MLDLRYFREHFEELKDGLAKKKFECDLEAVRLLDEERRRIVTDTEQLRAQQKAANAEMAKLDKKSEAFREKVAEMKKLAAAVKEAEVRLAEVETAWNEAFLAIPNVPDPSVPEGRNEDDNVVVATWGDCEQLISEHAKPHYAIEWFDRLIDLGRGSKVTGAGWPFYFGDMARLVRALLQFFLEENRQAGFVEVQPPLCVNPDSALATGQLPDKEGQMYHVGGDDLYLIPTAEVPVTNYFRNEILRDEDLPYYLCAYTPCFRREAGSYGKDVRGLNRLHQFDKVELVKWVRPETSRDELESLRTHVESLLKKLNLPFRTLLMCTGDIGFPHSKQYDLEVWAGGQKRWLEVSSCSSFTDFQARRANIRFRGKDGKPQFVHTLNGSGLAIPRVLASVLENNLQADGSVRIPEVVQPWFGAEELRA